MPAPFFKPLYSSVKPATKTFHFLCFKSTNPRTLKAPQAESTLYTFFTVV